MFKKIIITMPSFLFLFSVLAPSVSGTNYQIPQKLFRVEIPFLVKLNVGDPDSVIATNGDLKIYIRCDQVDNGPRISLIGFSDKEFAGNTNNGSLNPAGTEKVIESRFTHDFLTPIFDNEIDDGTIINKNFDYIGVDSETMGWGLNIFDYDCFAMGTAIIIKQKCDLRCLYQYRNYLK